MCVSVFPLACVHFKDYLLPRKRNLTAELCSLTTILPIKKDSHQNGGLREGEEHLHPLVLRYLNRKSFSVWSLPHLPIIRIMSQGHNCPLEGMRFKATGNRLRFTLRRLLLPNSHLQMWVFSLDSEKQLCFVSWRPWSYFC